MLAPIMDGGLLSPAERRRRAGILKRAEVALQFGHVAEAEALCHSVLHADSGHSGALELLARTLWRASRYEDLIAIVRRLVAINPYEPGYQVLLAAAFECLGQYGEAIEAHRRAGSPQGDEAIAELRAWQGSLVAELVRTDPVFRAHYAQNAYEACHSRGFEFSRVGCSEEPWLQPTTYSAHYGRPS